MLRRDVRIREHLTRRNGLKITPVGTLIELSVFESWHTIAHSNRAVRSAVDNTPHACQASA